MSIDLLREQPVTVAFARKMLIPQFGDKPISPATAYRWIERGALAGDGSRVFLEAVKVGRQLMTTRESIQRFFDELTRRSAVVPKSDTELPGNVAIELRAEGLLPSDAMLTTAD